MLMRSNTTRLPFGGSGPIGECVNSRTKVPVIVGISVSTVSAKLYWFPASHPAHAARKMLELKGIEYRTVGVLPGTQRIHMRLAGFRGGPGPGLKLDRRRLHGA